MMAEGAPIMRTTWSRFLVSVVAVAIVAAPQSGAAQGRGKGGGNTHPPKPPTASTHVASPAALHGPSKQGASVAVKPVRGPAHQTPAATSSKPATVHKNAAVHTNRTGGSTAALMMPAPQLAKHPKLAAKLLPLLPPGTNPTVAAAGFKNAGQFVAAVHVSNNLGIPFDLLKARMTGPRPMSLGQAIAELRPTVSVDREVRRAEAEMRVDLSVQVR
jgi:hypothetical protein